jgi:ATP-dependent protease HslVU (ClpYQ) peptidase subunit
MTTIAFKDGILACESQVTNNNAVCGYCQSKIQILEDIAIGFSGSLRDQKLFVDWYKAGEKIEDRPKYNSDNWESIIINVETKEVSEYHDGYLIEYKYDFYALGSGCFLATGAMAAGATAEEAVKIACKYDIYSSGEIHVLDLNEYLNKCRDVKIKEAMDKTFRENAAALKKLADS